MSEIAPDTVRGCQAKGSYCLKKAISPVRDCACVPNFLVRSLRHMDSARRSSLTRKHPDKLHCGIPLFGSVWTDYLKFVTWRMVCVKGNGFEEQNMSGNILFSKLLLRHLPSLEKLLRSAEGA